MKRAKNRIRRNVTKNPEYQERSALSTFKFRVNPVRSRETIHGLPLLTCGRAIMHFAFGQVRRKIARLRTYPKI